MLRALLLLLALSLIATTASPVVHAQVRRCELPTGQTIYTDRRCEAVGAVERKAAPAQPQLRGHRPMCARNLRDLYFEVSASIESRDVNRLAGVYHWTGMSSRQGYDVMQRLQSIVDRPLVDLQPIYPGADDSYAPGRAPVGFRVEQTSARGSTPVRAVLGLRKHLDCWWITLGGVARPASQPPASDDAPLPDAPEALEPTDAPSVESEPTR